MCYVIIIIQKRKKQQQLSACLCTFCDHPQEVGHSEVHVIRLLELIMVGEDLDFKPTACPLAWKHLATMRSNHKMHIEVACNSWLQVLFILIILFFDQLEA